jgi:hypothetical protein
MHVHLLNLSILTYICETNDCDYMLFMYYNHINLKTNEFSLIILSERAGCVSKPFAVVYIYIYS